MSELTVAPATNGLGGRILVPGDKSVSHRVLLLAALAAGTSTLRGLSTGLDVHHTARAIAAFGADVSSSDGGRSAVIRGGPDRLHEPQDVVDVGNSGTGIRLLAGWAAARPGLTVLKGDASVACRPMGRVTQPLREMGAHVDGRHDGAYPPLVVRGGGLVGIDHEPAVASAQVKAAVLLAGLAAEGDTAVREPVPTRRHTEELLERFGADVEYGSGWAVVRRSELRPADVVVPADPSHAAFWAVAASVVAGSDIALERVYLGPCRTGFVDVLRRMGADITVEDPDPAERTATLRVRWAALHGTDVEGAEVPDVIDEIPVLAVAAAFAEGRTTFGDAGELRVKESDRIATTVAALRALGATAEERPDGLVVDGAGGGRAGEGRAGEGRAGGRLPGGRVDAAGDHRIAMAAAVAGLACAGGATITGWEAVATSYPGFEEDLQRCRS